jgi:predicted nucleic acid-binding protein
MSTTQIELDQGLLARAAGILGTSTKKDTANEAHRRDRPAGHEVQGLLAQRAQHRSISIPDLLIAATAERHALTLLHYDGDYERIAELTGQAVQWVAPRGTADG